MELVVLVDDRQLAAEVFILLVEDKSDRREADHAEKQLGIPHNVVRHIRRDRMVAPDDETDQAPCAEDHEMDERGLKQCG